jgi:hypothetical protein
MTESQNQPIFQENSGDFLSRLAPLLESQAPLTEQHLWETLAENWSPEWAAARAALRESERRLARLNSPEHAPLGAIGHALDSAELNDVQHHHTLELAKFTVINESLLCDETVGRLLETLRGQIATVESSLRITHETPDIPDPMPRAPGKIGKVFGAFAARVLKRPSPAPAPLSPEI